ncbi:MAG: hypothetical protein ACK57B_06525 [Betaproteobacteria bacterium]
MGATRKPLPARRRSRARGVALIDVLVAVVVFSVGVLAVVGLQGTATQQSSQARYRAEATLLANALISRMWLTDRQVATLQANFAPGNAAYEEWLATVAATLPGVAASAPTVTVQAVAGGASAPDTARVTVQMWWRSPAAPADAAPNQLVMVTQIR